uniref:MICOS complex subunit n=1 Tax=Eutreptiella gymnastica TaxID=73025 RepID=A0A7S1IT00_9EUGL|mmetsp:Transcript_40818/g.73089  ORF Transcript_40818/g.73089 Transcript_40818/m.73089 type:complete len:150 (+) Transcript_40818:55-504(+)
MPSKEEDTVCFWEGEWLPLRNAITAARLWYNDTLKVGVSSSVDGTVTSIRIMGSQAITQLQEVEQQLLVQRNNFPTAFPIATMATVATASYLTATACRWPRKTTTLLCTTGAAIWLYPQQYAKFAFAPVKTIRGVMENPLEALSEATKK